MPRAVPAIAGDDRADLRSSRRRLILDGLGIIVSAQVLIGRYTGYRLTELRRFRHLAEAGEST